MNFTEMGGSSSSAVIKVIGVGGGGGNAINNMIESKVQGVDFLAANTDIQDLEKKSGAQFKIKLGEKLTKGLGAGGNPEIGRESALESANEIKKFLDGADMVFVAVGMGGGTGTGAAPVIAQIAKEVGALTVAILTKPFTFEGKHRKMKAEEGIKKLIEVVDSMVMIPNDRLLAIDPKLTFVDAFKKADEVLCSAVRGISDLISVNGMINLDFADVKAAMSGMGLAIMGIGYASGENRAKEAVQKAITSPLLEDFSIDGAKKLLINITGGPDMTMNEANEAMEIFNNAIDNDACETFFGAGIDPNMGDKISISVIATGIEDNKKEVNISQQIDSKTVAEEKVIRLHPAERADDILLDSNKNDVDLTQSDFRGLGDDPFEIPTYIRNGRSKH